MVNENDVVKCRKLSLDIESASKAVNLRPAVWKTPIDYNPPTIKELKVNFTLNGAAPAGKRTKRKKKKSKREEGEEGQGDLSPRTPPVVEPVLSLRERYLTWRYAMVILFQFSFVVAVFLRNNMPVALVCMIKPSSASSMASSSGLEENSKQDNTSHEDDEFEFEWDGRIQSLLLTGSILLSFAGPLLASALQTFISKKNLLTVGAVCAALLTVLCPEAARISPYWLVAIRVVLGILFGFNVPVVSDSLVWWSPQGEKLTMVAFTFAGINVGGIFTSSISGFLCSIPFDNGWPFIFYVFGFLALVWGVAWHFLSSQKPEDHPFISETEKAYIIAHRANLGDADYKKKEKPPYGKILRSVPVLAFLVSGCFQLWVVTILISYLPIYYVDVLGFTVQQAGVIISVSVVGRMLGALMWSLLGNCLSSRFNTRTSRKLCITVGLSLAGLSLIGMSFFDRSSRWISFGLLVIASLAQSVGVSTLTAVALDMAPRYAGLLTGMFISVASLVAITGPPIVSLLTPTGSSSEWQMVMILAGGVNCVSALVFGILGSATIQPWAKIHRKSMPEISSPFVTMGRRISTFMERPPITPVSPAPNVNRPDGGCMTNNSGFIFSLDVETGPTHSSRGEQKTSKTLDHDFGYFGEQPLPIPYAVSCNQDGYRPAGLANEAFDGDKEDISEDESSNNDEEEEDVDNAGERGGDSRQVLKQHKRAYSECGLEVLKLHNTTHNAMEGPPFTENDPPNERRRKTAVVERPTEISTHISLPPSASEPGETAKQSERDEGVISVRL